jgi:hypothetical protein
MVSGFGGRGGESDIRSCPDAVRVAAVDAAPALMKSRRFTMRRAGVDQASAFEYNASSRVHAFSASASL